MKKQAELVNHIKAESGATNTKYLVENGIHVEKNSPHRRVRYHSFVCYKSLISMLQTNGL